MSEASLVVKRRRSDNVESTARSGPGDYLVKIGSLPLQMICTILADAALKHPDVATSIDNAHCNMETASQMFFAERFDDISQQIWTMLNVLHMRLGRSEQVDKAGEVWFFIQMFIKQIRKETRVHSDFATKKSAMEALWKIGNSINSSTGVVAHEVRRRFGRDSRLERAMLRVAARMTIEERNSLMTTDFVNRLVYLERQGSKSGRFRLSKEVRLVLLGEKEPTDVETDTEEDEDEDDEDEKDEEESSESNE